MFWSVFSYFDIFRVPVYFYIKGDSKLSTHAGIFFSTSIYIFLLVSFLKSDFFEKKSPIVISQSLQMPRADIISFDPNTLLTFSVSDANRNSYVDPTIFKVQFKYFHVRSNGFGATEVLSLENRNLHICSKEDFAFNTSVYDKLSLKNSFCLDNKTFDISGFWDEPEVKYIAVNLIPCDNSTDNVTCKSPDEIMKFFTSPFKFFSVTYHNVQIDFYNYENPINIVYKVDYQLVDLTMMKRFNIFLKNSLVTTDDGWIFPNENVKTDIMYASKDNDFQSRSILGSPAFQILMYASKEKMIVTRRYQKLPEVLGSLAGMTQALVIICFVFAKIVVHVKNLREVLNQLYYFPKINEKEKSIYKNAKANTRELFKIEKEKDTVQAPITNNFNETNDLKKFNNKESNHEQVISNIKPPQKNLEQDSFILENYSQENRKISEIEIDLKSKNLKLPKKELQNLNNLPPTHVPDNVDKNNKTIDHSMNEKKSLFCKIIELFFPKKKVKSEHSFHLSFLEYGCYVMKIIFCLKLNEHEKLIQKAEKTFKSEMDIITILSRLHEINQLKMILLDDDQLLLFNYLTKPAINIDENIPTDGRLSSAGLKLSQRLRSSRSLITFDGSYDRVFKSREKNQINKRLIEYVDERHRKDFAKINEK